VGFSANLSLAQELFLNVRRSCASAAITPIASILCQGQIGVQEIFQPYGRLANPSFSTRGVRDPGSRTRTTSWSKGLPHKSNVLGLT